MNIAQSVYVPRVFFSHFFRCYLTKRIAQILAISLFRPIWKCARRLGLSLRDNTYLYVYIRNVYPSIQITLVGSPRNGQTDRKYDGRRISCCHSHTPHLASAHTFTRICWLSTISLSSVTPDICICICIFLAICCWTHPILFLCTEHSVVFVYVFFLLWHSNMNCIIIL